MDTLLIPGARSICLLSMRKKPGFERVKKTGTAGASPGSAPAGIERGALGAPSYDFNSRYGLRILIQHLSVQFGGGRLSVCAKAADGSRREDHHCDG